QTNACTSLSPKSALSPTTAAPLGLIALTVAVVPPSVPRSFIPSCSVQTNARVAPVQYSCVLPPTVPLSPTAVAWLGVHVYGASSSMPVPRLHRNAWSVPSAVSLDPITNRPSALTLSAVLLLPPSVPRSTIPCPLVHRKPCDAALPTVALSPTTTPLLL